MLHCFLAGDPSVKTLSYNICPINRTARIVMQHLTAKNYTLRFKESKRKLKISLKYTYMKY